MNAAVTALNTAVATFRAAIKTGTYDTPIAPPEPTTPVTPPTSTETRENEDGTTTIIVTDNRTGTVTETTEKADGSVEVVVKETDGSVTETTTAPDGSKTEKVTDSDQNVNITVTGYSDTAFGPKDTITREQLAVMLYRFAKLLGTDTSAGASTLNRFTDKDSIHTWAADAMAWCVSNGIIQGIRDDVLSPANLATRAQVAVMLDRFIDLIQ